MICLLPSTGETQPSGQPGLVFLFFGVVADKYAEGVIFAVADVDAWTDNETNKSNIVPHEHGFDLRTNRNSFVERIGYQNIPF